MPDLTVLDDVPHTHPAGLPCLACGRDAAEAAVAAERKRITAAVEALGSSEWRDCGGACHDNTLAAVLAIINREDTDA